jgi:uncharacterized integral membrane protein
MSKLDEKHEGRGDSGDGRRVSGRLVVVGVIVVALGTFVLQNTDDVKVKWLIFNFTAPLWIILLVTAALALVLGEAVGVLRKRGKAKTSGKKDKKK